MEGLGVASRAVADIGPGRAFDDDFSAPKIRYFPPLPHNPRAWKTAGHIFWFSIGPPPFNA
jgi:hypothetical protein